MKIICISGKRGSGKSLLGKMLERHNYVRLPLARALKDKAMIDFDLIPEQVDGIFKEQPTQYKDSKGKFMTPRDIMIKLGAFYRSIDSLYWCHKVGERIRDYDDAGMNVVIDDIRFLNEVQYFKSLKATFVRLERKSCLNVFKTILDDPSETELDNYTAWDHKLSEDKNVTPHDLEVFAGRIA